MIIAVTGATGQLGRLVVEKLKMRVPAADIVALVRSPPKRPILESQSARLTTTRPRCSTALSPA